MKKTILWSLISAGITVLWIAVGKFAYAADATHTTPAVQHIMPAATVVQPITQPENFTPQQVTQIQKIIHDYLVTNPEVLVEASKTLQAQQEKQMQTAAMAAVAQNKQALFDDAQSPSIGNKEAPVTLVEFFDYQCGHCREMAPIIETLVNQDKNLRVIFKELPIFGGVSQYAAKAALAASMQPGKYYAFHNALFASTGALTKENVMKIAKQAGLNIALLNKDMNSPSIEKQLKDNFMLAQNLKIMGTPTFVIGNQAQTKFAYVPGAASMQELQTQMQSVM